MKNRSCFLMIVLLLSALLLAGCTSREDAPGNIPSESVHRDPSDNHDSGSRSDSDDEPIETKPLRDITIPMGIEEFEALLASQPLFVSGTKYIVQDDTYKTLYPDLLSAVIYNATDADIKNVVIAFAAWDQNNLPVKIKGRMDFSDGAYIKKVNYADINLVPGTSYGEHSGLALDDGCKIASFKAIVVSFETFQGDTWENPYFENFCALYEGVKYTDDLTVPVKIVDSGFEHGEDKSGEETGPSTEAEELERKLQLQPVSIINTNYLVQDEMYKTLYPDLLQAVLINNSSEDIKSAVVAFAAWDKNGLPVKIKGQMDFGDGSYIKKVSYADINLIPGATYGEDSGLALDDGLGITTFKAIVVSYETFDGKTWENPCFGAFCALYEGKKLTE